MAEEVILDNDDHGKPMLKQVQWEFRDTILVGTFDHSTGSHTPFQGRVAAFDLDHTLISPLHGGVHFRGTESWKVPDNEYTMYTFMSVDVSMVVLMLSCVAAVTFANRIPLHRAMTQSILIIIADI